MEKIHKGDHGSGFWRCTRTLHTGGRDLPLQQNCLCSPAAQRSVQGAKYPVAAFPEGPRGVCAGGSTGAHHRHTQSWTMSTSQVVGGTSPNSPLFVTILLTISSGYVDFPHPLPKPERPLEMDIATALQMCPLPLGAPRNHSAAHCNHPALSKWRCSWLGERFLLELLGNSYKFRFPAL